MTRRTMVALAAAALALPLTAGLAGAAAPSAAPPSPTTAAHGRRVCADPGRAGRAACHAIVRTDADGVRPLATAAPAGYGPADLQSAYALPSASAGAGRTIAIVDAYDLPTAESDLAVYRATFGLPAMNSAGGPTFRKVNQRGGTTPPAADVGWGQEIALDVQMASATCPSCNILLVEVDSPTLANLGAAVRYAAGVSGVVAISNSYGGRDAPASSAYDHPGIAVTASTGDSGYGVSYPASDPHVVAVGGTSLRRDGSTRGWGEVAWSGTGSGCSRYNPKPAFQNGVATGCGRRAIADVSAVADPATGVAVYDTYGSSGWLVFGGTSAAAPIVAGVYALGGGPYSPATPYRAAPGGLNDVARVGSS